MLKLSLSLTLLECKVKVFKNGQSKICGRQPLKNLKYGLLRQSKMSKKFYNFFKKILLNIFEKRFIYLTLGKFFKF